MFILNLDRQLPLPKHDHASGRSQQLTNRGFNFHQAHDFAPALNLYKEALDLDPKNSRAHYLSGQIHLTLHDYPQAFSSFESSHLAHPQSLLPLTGLLHLALNTCSFALIPTILELIPSSLPELSITPDFVSLLLTHSPKLATKLELQRHWQHLIQYQTHPYLEYFGSRPHSHQSGSKIRLGYLSSQFHHPFVGRQLLSLITLHDRDIFEIYAFSTTENHGTSMEAQIEKRADYCISKPLANISTLTSLIRHEHIDILVHLDEKLHLNAAGALTLLAAPIQLHYPGLLFPEYLPQIQATISDPLLNLSSPPLKLKTTWYQTTPQPLPLGTFTRQTAHLPENKVILTSLVEPEYLDLPTWQLWLQILQENPTVILFLNSYPPETQENLLTLAAPYSLDQNRILFANPNLSQLEILSLLPLTDLYLESLYRNHHHLAAIALQLSIPTITVKGSTPQTQTTSSLLQIAHLESLITTSSSNYQKIASNLISSPDKRAHLKTIISTTNLPFLNPQTTLPQYEQSLQNLWQKYSQKPE